MSSDTSFTEVLQVKLLKEIEAGSALAFKEVYHHFYKKLLQFSFIIVKNKEAAEECVEDVFIKIWRSRSTASAIRNLKIYLYTATKNTSLNYLSCKANSNIYKPFDAVNVVITDPVCPDELLIYRETFNKIKIAIESLPPKCKMIFKLIREDGLKYKEVSEILNLSPHTVDAQMTIAIRRIAFLVKEDFAKTKGTLLPKK
ncbi:MAG: RNA polymerase sigma-70 factor [Ginsengibacter sp.]